jgi:hypothetical protein
MRNKKNIYQLVLLLLIGFTSNISAFEISDLDGTWTYNAKHLERTDLSQVKFSWGIGKTIPNTTMSIDIGKKRILLADGGGGVTIVSVVKESDDIIVVTVYISDDRNMKILELINFIFHFESHNRFWIECPRLSGWYEGKDWPYYRLSGPSR